MAAAHPDPRAFAPLRHPRRDPILRRPRVLAALVCSLAHALVFAISINHMQHGLAFAYTPVAVMALATLIVATRLTIMVDVFLAVLDRSEGLDTQVSSREIVRRSLVGAVLPLGLSVGAVAFLDNQPAALWCMTALFVNEMVYRLGGFSRWQGESLSVDVIRAILLANAERGVDAVAKLGPVAPRNFESNALAVASLAIRQHSAGALDALVRLAGNRLAATDVATRHPVERALLIIEADRARMDDPSGSAEREALALRAVNPGHPRRLALALFVATAALDADQPEAAIKALARLHSRDVMASGARVIVNWLLSEAARRVGDNSLLDQCRAAMATFDLRREAGAIATNDLEKTEHADPYARWMLRARRELLGEEARATK